MAECLEKRMLYQLQKRKKDGTLRKLIITDPKAVDFCSNDYLGLASSSVLEERIETEFRMLKTVFSSNGAIRFQGSGGSRLLAGNSKYAEDLEKFIASFHKRDSALIFNSGYDANFGILSCLLQTGDAIIFDELVHNSMRVGIQLGRQSTTISFRHNDCDHMENCIINLRSKEGVKQIFVAIESVYSMDGDIAPMVNILNIASKYKAAVIIDEAHATGVFGKAGEGLIGQLKLFSHPSLLCSVHTFGKALGVHGAAVLGRDTLKSYLINYARPLIYSTSLPLHSLVSIRAAYTVQMTMDEERQYLYRLIRLFRDKLVSSDDRFTVPLSPHSIIRSISPIQMIIIPGNDRILAISNQLIDHGYDVKAIRKPTVKEGSERLRICIHVHNSEREVTGLVHHIRCFVGRKSNCAFPWCEKTKTMENSLSCSSNAPEIPFNYSKL